MLESARSDADFCPPLDNCRTRAGAPRLGKLSRASSQVPSFMAVSRHVRWSRLALVPWFALLLAGCHAQPQVQPEPAKKVAKRAAARAKRAEARKEHEAEH